MRANNYVVCWPGKHVPGKYKAVSAGTSHSCGLRTDNTIVCWGNNDSGQTEVPDGEYKAVSAGTYHSCGLRTDSTMICWGNYHAWSRRAFFGNL